MMNRVLVTYQNIYSKFLVFLKQMQYMGQPPENEWCNVVIINIFLFSYIYLYVF